MLDTNKRTQSISEFLKSLNIEGTEDTIRNCLSLVHSISPIDGAAVFAKMEKLLQASDELAYVILMINRRRTNDIKNLNSVKDPLFTSLVRQNRPSTLAIECEIRLQKPEVLDLENKISQYDDLLLYLNHIDRALSEYVRILRDKLNYK